MRFINVVVAFVVVLHSLSAVSLRKRQKFAVKKDRLL